MACKISARESSAIQARVAAETALAEQALENLALDPNWMPETNPVCGTLSSGEPYRLDVQITSSGSGRSIAATAQVLDPLDKRTLAEQLLTVKLAKQVRDNRPTAAIAAFATNISAADGPPVYVSVGTTIRGNIRSKGPIQFQTGFVLQGIPYAMGNVASDGTGSAGYLTYRASWGTVYQAQPLAKNGSFESDNRLHVNNVVLGPSAANPMGVFYHTGADVVLDNNVTITGTVAVLGDTVKRDVEFKGSGIKLFSLQQAVDPASNTTFRTTFPAVVVDGSIFFNERCDAVRISGLVLASQNVKRLTSNRSLSPDSHIHTLSIDAIPDPFGTSDGPAIYVKGAIMANRVLLSNRAQRPFALVFDAATTDVTDAPGFFTWKVAEWTQAN